MSGKLGGRPLSREIAGRVIAITGASSGIGMATARVCAQYGAKVSLGARREERVKELARELGGDAIAVACDVGDEQQGRFFIERTRQRFGRIDALVNSAGVLFRSPIDGASTEEWRQMVRTNVMGVLYCTHAALAIMRSQRTGHIVNLGSVGGTRAVAGVGVYCLTKFAIHGFTEALRQELAGSGICVTLIEPGTVGTKMVAARRLGAVAAVVEPVTPAAIAETIVYALQRPAEVTVAGLRALSEADPRPW